MTEMVDFKEPGREELAHTFLWKSFKMIPVRGKIGIFNRSYYEEIVTTRVHPELILNQNIPGINSVADITGEFWSERIFHINSFEKHLASEGYLVLKFFLNLSWSKQRDRFLRRIRKPEKHWKFSYKDIEERNFWNSYRSAYQKAVESTSTKYAPWYIIPADHKWVMRTAVSEILVKKMEELGLDYPVPDQETIQQMERAKNILKEG
jgi:polyphosphate kinase 2 (PPK2 family)